MTTESRHAAIAETSFVVMEVFEIKERYATGHQPGLVAILDRLITQDPKNLIGKMALVETPVGQKLHLRIEDAREHGTVNSLFFQGVTAADLTIGSAVDVSGSHPTDYDPLENPMDREGALDLIELREPKAPEGPATAAL